MKFGVFGGIWTPAIFNFNFYMKARNVLLPFKPTIDTGICWKWHHQGVKSFLFSVVVKP